jgi:hypothetical protein
MRTETFQTPGPVQLDIRLGAGEVSLETADIQETTVVLEPLRDSEATLEAVATARIELRERGGGHEIVVDVRGGRGRGFGFSRGAEVLVRVSCPEETSVEARSGSADIEGRGRFGAVEVETGSGEVEFGDIAHDAKISAASGDIEIRTVGGEGRISSASGDVQVGSIGGEGKVNSASGDVLIREVGGPLEVNSASGDVIVKEAHASVVANTASGDQIIGRVSEGTVKLNSASGDLKIGIKEGSRLFVDARSRSGEVSSELEVSDVAPAGDAPLVELRANTMSGDISIVRA